MGVLGSLAVQVAPALKPETVKSAVSAACSFAVASVALTLPVVQTRAIVTSGSGEAGLSGAKFLVTLNVAVFRLFTIVQAEVPPAVMATATQADSSLV